MIAQSSSSHHSSSVLSSPNLNPNLKGWISKFFHKTDQQWQPTFLGHAALATLLSSLVVGGYIFQTHRAGERLNNWLNPISNITSDSTLQHLDNQMASLHQSLSETQTPSETHSLQVQLAEKARLKNQLLEIDKRLARYRWMMIYFYSRNHASITLTTLSALIAGSSLLLISRTGWERVNNVMIHLFFFSSGCVLLFSDIAGIFQYDANYQNVTRIYTEHMTLKSAIQSFIATGGFIQENPVTGETEYVGQQDVNRFIYYIDQQMAKFNQIPLAIDQSSLQRVINSVDIRNQLEDGISFDVPVRADQQLSIISDQ